MVTKTAVTDPISADLKRVMRQLKLGPMLDTLPERLTLARQQHLSHVAFLELVLADEASRRDASSAARRARAAGLDPTMRIDTWDESAAVRYDHTCWTELTSLRFLDGPHGALLLGAVGVGKTHLATALGHIAVRRRVPTLMLRADAMFKRLKASRLDNSTEAEMRRLAQTRLLIIDDFALQPMDATETADFYELVVARHHKASTVQTSPDVPTARRRLMDLSLRLTEAATVRKLLPEAFVRRASRDAQHLTGVQADAILGMQLQRLTGLEIEKLAQEYSRLAEEIEGYEAILADESLLMDVISEDIHEMGDRYGDERRTEIIGAVGEFNIEDLIAEEDVVVTLSHEGYIKRTPLTTYRRQGRGGLGIIGSEAREGDFVEQIFIASTHDYLLVLLNNGRMHWLKVYDIPSMARTSKGRAIVNLLDTDSKEKICTVVAVREFDDRFLMTATKLGQIKKTSLSAYANPRRGGIQATGLDEGDLVVGAGITRGSDEIVLGTANGQAIRFHETDVRPMGRTAAGVRGISLHEGDEVVDMALMDPMATLLTVCENGYGKRTEFDEYRVQSRGGLGIINIRTTDRNGKVVAMKSVRDADELMLITLNGMVVRIGLGELRTIGRATQGVRVISLKSGDKLVGVARVASEESQQGQLPMGDKARHPEGGQGCGPLLEGQAQDANAPADEDQPGEEPAPPEDAK